MRATCSFEDCYRGCTYAFYVQYSVIMPALALFSLGATCFNLQNIE